MLNNSITTRPFQLPVVCEQGIRASQREVRPQTGALCDVEPVKKPLCIDWLSEKHCHEIPVSSISSFAAIVESASAAVFGIVNMLDVFMCAQELHNGFCTGVDTGNAGNKIAPVTFHYHSIQREISIDEGRTNRLVKDIVARGIWIQYKAVPIYRG